MPFTSQLLDELKRRERVVPDGVGSGLAWFRMRRARPAFDT